MATKSFSPKPGDVYGRLTVLELVQRILPGGSKRSAALCRCECGSEVEVLMQNLKNRTRSCGCLKKRGTMSDTFRDSRVPRPRLFSVNPGDVFDRLVVVREQHETAVSGKVVWVAVCLCSCGTEMQTLVNNLKSGITRSCGCLQREHASRIARSRAIHGLTVHPHYARWNNMRKRCDDPLDRHYKNYGARGIRVCDEWYDVAVFIAYLETVLGPCPDGHSLDRTDNNGNYEPGNVRWADPVTQRHNQRRGTSWKSHDAD